jgi:hypothetical protein
MALTTATTGINHQMSAEKEVEFIGIIILIGKKIAGNLVQ